MDEDGGTDQYPLCETDYFRRLDLLCFECGGALRGSYITAVERKYHIEHFTCSVCPTVFGAQDSYYEHEGKVYCHYHYSTQFAERCTGCHTAILKQFVEIFRNGQNQHWHPECYMIQKFWTVRLAPHEQGLEARPQLEANASTEERVVVRENEEKMEEKVYRIWSVLSAFEESSAACISDMLLHVSNGAYVDGVFVAKKFIWHVNILFQALDRLDYRTTSANMKGRNTLLVILWRWQSPLRHLSFRVVLRSRGKVIMQKDCCVFLPLIKDARYWRPKVGCHTGVTVTGYGTGSLSETSHSNKLARCTETRARDTQHRRPPTIPR